jgi:AraC family transcriptional regulator
MAPTDEAGPEASERRGDTPSWAHSILPAPALASRQWSHALARRCREPARVAGFVEPASNVHHIVMARDVGFQLEVRELGTGRTYRHDVGPGELCIAGAGTAPSELGWRSQGRGRTMDVVELYTEPSALRTGATGAMLSLEPRWRVLRDGLLLELLRELDHGLDRPDAEEELFGELLTTLFAAQLERAHGVVQPNPGLQRGGLSPFVLRSVRDYVAAHLGNQIRLEKLAALAQLSPFHFSRAFKASTGWSPHRYVLNCRIAEAKRLLSSSRLSIADIARRTGFSSTGQLSTRFRAWTGTTPSAFRCLSRP